MENEGQPMIAPSRNMRYLTQFFMIIALTLLLGGAFQFIGVFVVRMIFQLDLNDIQSVLSGTASGAEYHGALYMLIAFNALSFLVPALSIPAFLKENPSDFMQINTWAKPRMYILAAALLIVAQPLITLLVEWNTAAFDLPALSSYKADALAREKEVEAIFLPLLQKGGALFFILNLFIFAIFPAISEEFLFRGVIQKHLYNWTGNVHVAVILAGTIFSIFHLQWMGFLPRMVLGIALGYLVVYSGTIWVSILAHAVNNSLAVIQHYPWSGGTPAVFRDDYDIPIYYALISLVLSGLLIYLLQRYRTRPEEIPS